MLEETGCDFVMVGRGALGNPWVFRELDAAYKGEDIPSRPSPEEIRDMMIKHLDMLAALKGEHVAVREFRKYIMRYTKGMAGASSLRRSACEITDIGEMRSLITRGNEN
jgi:tRNA-dihydrouridine synthase B